MRRFPLALLVVWCTMSCSGLDRSQKDRAGSPDLPEPAPTAFYTEQGIASWYGKEFHQKPTATGEVYDMYAMTAAHKTLPLGTWVVVTDLGTQRSVRVRINDRGPFVKDRIIDLSYGAADELGILEKGTTRVEVRCSYSEETLRETTRLLGATRCVSGQRSCRGSGDPPQGGIPECPGIVIRSLPSCPDRPLSIRAGSQPTQGTSAGKGRESLRGA